MKHYLRILPWLFLLLCGIRGARAATPTLPSSGITFNTVEGNHLGFYWTRGDGAKRIVIAKAGGPVQARPVNGRTYTPNPAFGQGEAVGAGEYVIGYGNLSQLTTTGLTSGVTYYFAVFEFNGDNATTEYLTTAFMTANKATEKPPVTQVSNIQISDITGSKATIKWTNGNGYGRLLVMREGSPVDAQPTEFVNYNANANFGVGAQIGTGNYVVYNWYSGSATQTVYRLKNGTTYHIAAYEFNGWNGPAFTRPAATATFNTPSEPSKPPGAMYSDSRDTRQFRMLFPAGDGTHRLVIGKKGSPVTSVPTDGTVYTADSEFGKGTRLGTDEFVVYAGTEWLKLITGLEPGTTYHFRTFEYNEANTTDYLTSAFSEGSATTLTTPTASPTILQLSDIRAFQMTANWDKGDGNSRILIGKANGPVDITPEDFKAYSASGNFGTGAQIGNGNFVLSEGNQTQVTIYQLTAGVTYHFALLEANGSVAPMYLKPGITASATTNPKPTTHPNSLSIDSRMINSLRVYCNMGNGTKLLVIGKKGSPVTAVPVDKEIYTGSWKFEDGDEIAPGEFVIHSGTWNAPTVNNLEPNTTYHFRVINYNEVNGEPFYYTADPMTDGSGSTIDYARPQASNLTFPEIQHTSVKLKFDAGGGTRRLVIYKAGGPVDANPANGAGYGAGSALGNGNIVAGYTTSDELTATGLTAGTNYHFAVYEITPTYYFYTPDPLRGQTTTTGATQTITFPDFTAKTYGDADFDLPAQASSGLPISYDFSSNYVEVVNGKFHIIRSGTVTVTARQPGDAIYAPATPVSKDLTIAKKALTIRAANKTIAFGDDIPALTATYDGFVLGETEAALSKLPTLSTDAKKGDPSGDYTINITGATATNYDITHASGILTIQPPPRTPQTINFPPLADLRYGMGHTTLNARATSNLPIVYQSSNTAIAQVVNGQIQIVKAGTVKITAYCPGDQTWEDAPPVEITVNINKADLSIIADDKSMTQGDVLPALTLRFVGFQYGEQENVLTAQPRITTTATRNSLPGEYDITITGATSPNYAITFVKGTMTVLPRPKLQQTIDFPAITGKTYGNALFAPGATATSTLTVAYHTTTPTVVEIVNGRVKIVGTGNASVTASQAGNNDYEAAPEVTRTFAVQGAPLQVKADNKTKVEGQANPTLTVTYTGFVNGETVSVLTQRATPTTAVTESTPAGEYDIFPGSAAAANYTMNYVNGKLTVTAKPRQAQTITFPQPAAKTYGDGDFAGGAQASSGLEVRYTSLTPAVATIINGQIHILKAGTATIRAEQDGNNDYRPATAVSRNIVINKATLNAKPDDKSKVYRDPNPVFTIAYTGFVNGDDAADIQTPPVVNTRATATSDVGNYEIWLSGGTDENYQFSFREGKLDITPRSQTITFDALAGKQYGDADFALAGTAASGLAVTYVNETPDIITITGTQVRILKAGRASIRATQAGNNNWQAAAPVTRAFDISKAPLTVTADNKTRVEGTDNPAFTLRYTGFVNGDDAGDIQTQPLATTTATRNSQPGNYDITVAGGTADNYRFIYVKGTLTVTPAVQTKPQTITFPALAARTYGAADFAPGASASSNLAVTYASSNPDVASIVNGNIHIVGAGTTTITARQAGNNDWLAAAPVSRTFTVEKAWLTATAHNKTKEAGTPNPQFSLAITGFVLNEAAHVLTRDVTFTSPANEYSRPGKYPIIPGGGAAANYHFRYVNGILTVTPKITDNVKAWCSSRSTLQVRIFVMEAQRANIFLYTTSGQQVSPFFRQLNAGSNTIQIDVSNIPTGMYILHINGDKTKLSQNIAIN
ncbi:MBG domain-containing protein [Chitinophaga pollutisoli]|uniref:MBG domain-containing protein n=1 Tax=Chitinophaga pollutisoli TaxID=3133966 RepID=A0ABZ2YTG6_9BACT